MGGSTPTCYNRVNSKLLLTTRRGDLSVLRFWWPRVPLGRFWVSLNNFFAPAPGGVILASRGGCHEG